MLVALCLAGVFATCRLLAMDGGPSRFVVAGTELVDPAAAPRSLHVEPGHGYDGQFFHRLALAQDTYGGSWLYMLGENLVSIGFVVGLVRKHVTDTLIDSGLSFLTPFAAYVAAEQVHASGVISVVVAGLLLGHKSPILAQRQLAGEHVTLLSVQSSLPATSDAARDLLGDADGLGNDRGSVVGHNPIHPPTATDAPATRTIPGSVRELIIPVARARFPKHETPTRKPQPRDTAGVPRSSCSGRCCRAGAPSSPASHRRPRNR